MKSLTRTFSVKRLISNANGAIAALDGLETGETSAPPQLTAQAEAAIARGDQARDAREWTAAVMAYAEALAEAPQLAHIWVQYGHALKEDQRRDDAEAAYARALDLEPTNADTHLQLGHLLKLQGRTDEAAERYLDALELDANAPDALFELEALAGQGVKLPPERAMAVLGTPWGWLADGAEPDSAAASPDEALRAATESLSRLERAEVLDERGSAALKIALEALQTVLKPPAAKGPRPAGGLVFDVADLLGYFRNARLPTGIQRVQIEVVRSLAAARDIDLDVRVCGFVEGQDDWVEIPLSLFRRLCALSLSSGDVTDPVWLGLLRQLDLLLMSSRPIEFPDNACLVNLGTSWWLQNYFLNVRRAKVQHHITYVPFVHDFIPVMTPEHCVRELTQDFITWVLGVFQHADLFLVNSEATKRDLLAVAARLGHTVTDADVDVVRLDADCRSAQAARADERLLRQWGLRPGGYVLIVSTIESRKNHLGAFNAWLSLIRKHGPNAVPELVCVGSEGWLNDEVHAKLASSEVLRSRVKMLSRLSDEQLAALYQHCLFTLYPSHYEGWGLPVTESLCHGRPVLASDASSLPEAGGEFADYFQAGSDGSLAVAAERLIFDAPYRAKREAQIRSDFKPRAWADIGRQIGAAVSRLHGELRAEAPARTIRAVDAMPAALGVYYPVTRNFETRIWRGMVPGEMFRAGQGWWWPDDWGVWTKPGGGELAIRVDGPHRRLRIYLRIRGILDQSCEWSLEITSPVRRRPVTGRLAPDEWRWQTFDLPASDDRTTFAATLTADQTQDLALRTGGLDRRVTSIGLVGFYVCETDDLVHRLAFQEALLFHDLAPLTPGYDSR
jgi:glycosyltransferase involved in cell wall biosynthesis